jgi:signal transduction histidine kinase/ligand-binding sensor domain-containing protein
MALEFAQSVQSSEPIPAPPCRLLARYTPDCSLLTGYDAAGPSRRLDARPARVAVLLCLVMLGEALACASAGSAGFDDMRQTAVLVKDGAPASAYAFAQTPDGFLWIGNSTGLYRYDGASFTQPLAGQLSGVAIVSLLAPPDGDLWIGYIFGGVDRVHLGRVIKYPVGQLPGGTVRSFLRTSDGTLWVACFRGLARFDGKRWVTAGKESGYSGEEPLWIGSDQGDVIVLTDSAAFRLARSGSRFEPIDPLIARQLRWGAPPHRRWRAAELQALQDDPAESSALVDHTGAVWSSKSLAIRRITWPSGEAQPVLEEAALDEAIAAEVQAIFEDREGNVWVGTSSGLGRFSRSKLHRLTTVQSNGHTPLLIPKSDTTLWVSGYQIPLAELDGRPVNSPELGDEIVTYARASDGSLWLAGDLGVSHYTRAGVAEKTPPLPLGSPTQSHLAVVSHMPWESIAEDSAGVVWLAVVGHGQLCLKNGAWSAPDPALGLPARTATRILSDDRKRLWLSYPDNKVAVVAGGRSHIYTATDGLSIGNATALAVRGEHVWLGGDGGVAALINGRFVSLSAKSGDSFRAVAGIVETPTGELWLNAAAGLIRISRDSAARFLSGDTTPIEFELFDSRDGLAGGAPMLRPSPNLLQMPDGRIWVMRMNGVSWIDPNRIVRNRVAPRVAIERVVRDGEHLRIDYTASSLTSPERVRFRYRLFGMHESWQDVGSRRQAYYTNLGPGQYTFVMAAANEDGVWSSDTATASFSIPPTLYQSAWFRLAGLSVGGVLLWFVLRYRTERTKTLLRQRMHARHAERERIARDLHDTLLQGIQALLFRLQLWEGDPAIPPERRSEIAAVAVQAQAIAVEGRNRLISLRVTRQEREDLLESLTEVASAESLGKRARIEISSSGNPRPLLAEACRQLVDIAREAVRNSHQHARASLVAMTVDYRKTSLRLRIADDGCGIDPAVLQSQDQPGHFGLVGMRERAHQLKARFSVERTETRGTRVTVVAPAHIVFERHWRWPWASWRRSRWRTAVDRPAS